MTDKELDDLEAETREAAASARRCGHNYICEALTKAADAIAELRKKNAGLVERVGTLERAGAWDKIELCNKVSDLERQLAAANERAEKAEKQCAYSWVVIANSFGGDWSKASSEWQDMARACEWPRPAEIEELWSGD